MHCELNYISSSQYVDHEICKCSYAVVSGVLCLTVLRHTMVNLRYEFKEIAAKSLLNGGDKVEIDYVGLAAHSGVDGSQGRAN